MRVRHDSDDGADHYRAIELPRYPGDLDGTTVERMLVWRHGSMCA